MNTDIVSNLHIFSTKIICHSHDFNILPIVCNYDYCIKIMTSQSHNQKKSRIFLDISENITVTKMVTPLLVGPVQMLCFESNLKTMMSQSHNQEKNRIFLDISENITVTDMVTPLLVGPVQMLCFETNLKTIYPAVQEET